MLANTAAYTPSVLAPLPTVDIMEVTLRDGSYVVGFKFTAHDTALIASTLDRVGFRWIEIGHGLGMHASSTGKGEAGASDEEYLAAAAEAITHAEWGVFLIPGIGRATDIKLAAQYKASFLRVGCDITDMDAAEPYVRLAKDEGLFVSFNAMKSYAVSAGDFGRFAAKAQSWGTDIVCLVDSAGCMYPAEVRGYLQAARIESDVALGFHGHDNLSLAMANTLQAVECGAVLVDSSLQGMGRSAGNAVTEILVAVLQKQGLVQHVDLNAAMDAGQQLIAPRNGSRAIDPLAVTAGYARFHSSFMPKVETYARRYGLDVRDLIVLLCKESQVDAPDALLDRLSKQLAAGHGPQREDVPSPAHSPAQAGWF